MTKKTPAIMSGQQLKLLRKILMLTPKQAAEYIGKVKQRTWVGWELGLKPVPENVINEILRLSVERDRAINDGLKTFGAVIMCSEELKRLVKELLDGNKKAIPNPDNPLAKITFESVVAGIYSKAIITQIKAYMHNETCEAKEKSTAAD